MGAGIHKAIQLHADDNVVVCIQALQPREEILISGNIAIVTAPVGIGHKLACRYIRRGETIIKYGVPIGTATEDICIGAHVHTHNIRSNYIETYLIQ